MKKALIVAVVGGFLPQFEKNDVEILKSLGYEIHYGADFDTPVYAFDKAALEAEGIILHPLPIRKSPGRIFDNYRALAAIRRIVKEEKIDLVHCHNPMGGVCARLACLGIKKMPYVLYTAHGFHFFKGAPKINWLVYYTVERLLAHLTDGIITINKEDYGRAKRLSLRRPGNVHLIHSVGVDPDRFNKRINEYERVRKELGIPADAFHIVTAAELNDNKNQKVIIEAIRLVNKNNIHFTICGRGANQEHLSALIKEYQLEDRVHLLGYRDDMEWVLAGADLFSFSSKREGLGIAAIEALLCGVPLICSDNRGTREYAIDGVNAIVCKENNSEEYAEGILCLLNNPAKLREMAERCRESAMDFTLKNVGRTMEEIYKNISLE